MNQKIITFLFFLTTTLIVAGQEIKVTGVVSDGKTGDPVIGATIQLKGTENGVITDLDGKYEISSPSNGILIYSYVGLETIEQEVNGRLVIDVTMQSSSLILDEVVVVGFGTQKKANITGSTSTVNVEQILADRPIINSAQALAGTVPGLQVVSTSGQPGATGTSINIRGFTSINGGSPLILINNVPGNMEDLNPRDIESVTVLKDASASSIYGARAAYGVVLITTKQAKTGQKVKFDYSNTTSLSRPNEIPEKATTEEFVNSLAQFGDNSYFAGQNIKKWQGYLQQYKTDPSTLNLIEDPISGLKYPIHFDQSSGQYYPLSESDHINEFINHTGYSTIHNLGVSGGEKSLAYRLNFGFSDEDGVMVTNKDRYQKYNVNAQLTTKISSKLTSNSNIFYRYSDRKVPNARYDEAIQLRMYDPTGYLKLSDGTILPFESPANRVRFAVPNVIEDENIRLFQKLEFTPFKNFSITGEYTVEKNDIFQENISNGQRFVSTFQFVPTTSEVVAASNTSLRNSQTDRTYTGLNLYSKYNFSLGKNEINLLAGFNKENENQEYFTAFRNALIDPTTPTFNLSEGDNFSITDAYYDWAVVGYFGRLNFNHADKYFLEGNLRYDGSSRFAEGSRFTWLPSVSAGWNIAKEAFLNDNGMFSVLKLRASWGKIGNQNYTNPATGGQDYYPSIAGFESYNANWINLNSQQRYITFSPAQLVSSTFTWEKVETKNLGLDVGVLNDRLSASFDFYTRATIGMLKEALPLPAVLGTSAPLKNDADLLTRGWELQVGWQDKIKDFRYNVNVNLFDNQSEITRFDNPGQLISQYYVGQKIGEIWGYVTDGYYTVNDFEEGTLNADLAGATRKLKTGVPQIEGAPVPYPGDIKYKDLNGDGIINAGNSTLIVQKDADGNIVPRTGPGDRQIIGNTTRRYQFGINASVAYKGFDLAVVMNGVGKRDTWRATGSDLDLIFPYPTLFDHIYKHQLNFWTPDNQDAYFPRIYGDASIGNTDSNYSRSRNVQTKYLSDESYLRLQSISIGYTFPKSLVSKIRVGNLRLFAAANNIHTFDRLPKGMEPDQSTNATSRYPLMGQFSFGANVSF
ncbi:MAG: hypothetical protein RIR48_111 [Bacteroidota bacterium]|jgi:TonB-linked SusC/RagA family outer membrane protein